MRKQYIYALVALIGAMPGLQAQTLSEEVVIDREITPVVRPSSRPAWVRPSLYTPHVKMEQLSFHEYIGRSEITRTVTPLGSVAWADSVMRTPYRGYLSAGYFPVVNIGVSAGYRFVHNDRADVGARLSYDGGTWSGGGNALSKYRQHNVTVGVDGTLVYRPGKLTFDAGYTYSSSTMAYYPACYDRGTQSVNIAGLGLRWLPSSTGRFGWNLGADFNYGGFTDNKTGALVIFNTHVEPPFEFIPAKDVNFGVSSDLKYALTENSSVRLDLAFRLRHTNQFNSLALLPFHSESLDMDYAADVPCEGSAQTMGVITLTPGYRFAKGTFSGKLGVRVDVNTGGFQKNTHVAPDVDIQWAPVSFFGAYLRATGGEVMNTNAELWQRNPWMTGVFAFERSHVNADIELGLTFGSYRGFRATIYGGWSRVNRWITPVALEGVNTMFMMDAFSGFNYGLELGYSWKKYVSVVAHAAGATHGKYYRWQDGAAWAFDIAAKIRPIDRLQVEVGFEARVDRRGTQLNPKVFGNAAYYEVEKTSLGDVSNLFVGGQYEVTQTFSVYLKAENLLNHHWGLTDYVRSRGIHGLLGVQFKF